MGISGDSPLPNAGSQAFENIDNVKETDDNFFQQTNFKGAFGTENWLNGWSILSN